MTSILHRMFMLFPRTRVSPYRVHTQSIRLDDQPK